MKKLLLLIMVIAYNVYAQFDSLIFSKQIHLDWERPYGGLSNIYGLSDINTDGYDDFLVFDCSEQKVEIFFGGNPVDTIPAFSINGEFISSAILDVNDDNIKDLVLITRETPGKKVNIYYGGTEFDSIPDISFSPPQGAREWNFGWSITTLKDFNGDGRSELVIYNPELPFSYKQFGILYFYNTGSIFDTIPAVTVYGDSVDSVRIFKVSSSGDINGDAKSDFTLYGYKKNNGSTIYFRRFYLGNEQWDLTPDAEYFSDEHSFDPEYMEIIDDLNKDGKDDILIDDYGFYPYYFKDAILKGSFPIDTIPDWGLNTQNTGLNELRAVSLGDVNGDGFNDFMAPTYTVYAGVKLWAGGRNFPADNTADKFWISGEEGFCRDYAAVGDVNGDGVDDIAFGSIHYGGSDVCKAAIVVIFNGDTTVKADTVLSIKQEDFNPQGYRLFEPYPNPFNPITTIKYNIPQRSFVTIKVYDVIGTEIRTLVNEEKSIGSYETEFNATSLSSGVYFYRIQAGNFIQTKKMILLK